MATANLPNHELTTHSEMNTYNLQHRPGFLVVAVMHIHSGELRYCGYSIAAAAEALVPGTTFAKAAFKDVAIATVSDRCHQYRAAGFQPLALEPYKKGRKPT